MSQGLRAGETGASALTKPPGKRCVFHYFPPQNYIFVPKKINTLSRHFRLKFKKDIEEEVKHGEPVS